MVTPNSRSSHIKPKPTGAGISFVLVSSFGMLFLKNYIPLICLPLAIIGLIDDLKNVDFRLRFFIQFLTGIFLWYHSNFLLNNGISLNNFSLLFVYFFVAFVITSIINFTNFVDGIDGLLTSSLIIAFATSAIKIGPSIWIIVSSLLAFLIFNWSPSKVFMGDVGSTFLGGLFAGTIIQASSWQQSFSILLPFLPLLTDALICVVRRYFARENIFKAHSLHLFQRLYQAGWSHSKISIVYTFSALVLGVCSIFNLWHLSFLSLILIYLVAFYLDKMVAVPFLNSLENSKKLVKN